MGDGTFLSCLNFLSCELAVQEFCFVIYQTFFLCCEKLLEVFFSWFWLPGIFFFCFGPTSPISFLMVRPLPHQKIKVVEMNALRKFPRNHVNTNLLNSRWFHDARILGNNDYCYLVGVVQLLCIAEHVLCNLKRQNPIKLSDQYCISTFSCQFLYRSRIIRPDELSVCYSTSPVQIRDELQVLKCVQKKNTRLYVFTDAQRR